MYGNDEEMSTGRRVVQLQAKKRAAEWFLAILNGGFTDVEQWSMEGLKPNYECDAMRFDECDKLQAI